VSGETPYWSAGTFDQVDGFPRYPIEEMERRHRWLAESIAEHELDLLLVGGPTGPLETSIQYFSNWPSQVQSYLMFFPGQAPVLLVRLWNHLPDAQRIAMIDDVRYGGDTPAEMGAKVAALASEQGAERIGLIGVIPHADLSALREGNPVATLVDLNGPYQSFRLVKTPAEMVFVDIASRMNDAAIEALTLELRPGVNECDVPRIVEDVYNAHRAWNLIHFSLSTPMEAPEVCVPHQYHPDRVLQAGDVFVTEISTTFWGYAGQILRTFTIAADPTPRYKQLHDVAIEAYTRIVEVLRPGVTIGEVLDAAEVITDSGFDIWDDLVHGFGGAYLPPIVRTRANRGATHPDEFEYSDGTLLVVQPNVIRGSAGVQTGNSLQITRDGPVCTQRQPTAMIRCA
jgi:Xaa-Pro aminopeptidase